MLIRNIFHLSFFICIILSYALISIADPSSQIEIIRHDQNTDASPMHLSDAEPEQKLGQDNNTLTSPVLKASSQNINASTTSELFPHN